MRGLTSGLPTEASWVTPLSDASLHIGAGECVGLVGESQSGYTQNLLAAVPEIPHTGQM